MPLPILAVGALVACAVFLGGAAANYISGKDKKVRDAARRKRKYDLLKKNAQNPSELKKPKPPPPPSKMGKKVSREAKPVKQSKPAIVVDKPVIVPAAMGLPITDKPEKKPKKVLDKPD